jgi:hypothetical protein
VGFFCTLFILPRPPGPMPAAQRFSLVRVEKSDPDHATYPQAWPRWSVPGLLKEAGIGENAKSSALVLLEQAGLIKVDRSRGRSPRIALGELEAPGGQADVPNPRTDR